MPVKLNLEVSLFCNIAFESIICDQVKEKYIIKSGTDFRNMSKLTLTQNDNHTWGVAVEQVDLTSKIPEDADMKSIVSERQGNYLSVYLGLWLCSNILRVGASSRCCSLHLVPCGSSSIKMTITSLMST